MHLELISSPRIQHNVWGIIIELLVNAVKEMRRLNFCITRASWAAKEFTNLYPESSRVTKIVHSWPTSCRISSQKQDDDRDCDSSGNLWCNDDTQVPSILTRNIEEAGGELCTSLHLAEIVHLSRWSSLPDSSGNKMVLDDGQQGSWSFLALHKSENNFLQTES
jgi:hypothetical protein